MSTIPVDWLLVGLGFLCIALELFIGVETGFDLVLIGISFLAGGIVSSISHQPLWGISVSTALLFLYLLAGRRYIKSRLSISTHKTNTDSLIGATAIVTERITPHHKGKVRINDDIWLAKADDPLEPGAHVIVESIQGITLLVKKSTHDGSPSTK